MGYLETYDLAKAQSFRARLAVALVTYAGMVLTEGQGEKSVTHHAKRTALAQTVMMAPEDQVTRFIWPVLSNVSIANAGLDAPDQDLQFQLSQIWDTVAGVSEADKA